jgi:AbrB family looped-hinge helix DNA binding protein
MREKIVIDKAGSLKIPPKFRKAFGLKGDDELFVETTKDGILLRPALDGAIEMYTEARIAEFAREENRLGKVLNPAF